MSELEKIRARDAETYCARPECHQASADRRALLEMLDEVLPLLRKLREVLGWVEEPEMTKCEADILRQWSGM